MIFSVGNIITLIVVLIILAVYRQLDRNNRSLEKVKKYSDRVKEQLDEFVETKVTELKDLSIDIDVHQKTVREIFNRIREAEEELNARAERMGDIGGRIDEYDSALKDLADMTSRVDENLKRLQEESEFVDTVGKRLKEAAEKVDGLERSLPEIRDEFVQVNERALEEVKKEYIAATANEVSALEDRLEQTEGMVNNFSDYITALEARRDTMTTEAMESFRESAGTVKEEFTSFLEGRLTDAERRGEELGTQVASDVTRLEDEVERTESVLDGKLEEFQDRIGGIEEEYNTRIKKIAERGKTLEDEVFTQLKNHVVAKARDVKKELEESVESVRRDLQESEKELKETLGNTRSEVTVWQTTIRKEFEDSAQKLDARSTEIFSEMQEAQDSRRREFESFISNIRGRVEEMDTLLESKITESVKAVEERIADYEGGVSYRFQKIEDLNKDIDGLETSLRGSMEAVESRLQAEFRSFQQSLEERREADRRRAEESMDSLTSAMDEVDKGLSELKQKAYENVSEKLQVFEDEFFADLKERNDAVQRQFSEWKTEIGGRLEALAEEAEAGRREVENGYSRELKSKLSEHQSRIGEQLSRLEDQVIGFREGIETRMASTEQSLGGLQGNLAEELEDVKKNSKLLFEREFSAYQGTVQEELKKLERTVESKISGLDEDFESGKKDIFSLIESTQSDVTVWQAEVLKKMQDAEAEAQEQFTSFRTDTNTIITSIKEDFAAQKEELITGTREERERMKAELESIAEKVADLENELTNKTRESLEELSGRSADALAEFQSRTREFQTELDEKIRDFRVAVQDTREKIDGVNKKMTAKVEEDTKVLAVNLQEIEKKQKSFLAQTKLFERADSLKNTLQHNIEDLKAEIASVEVQAKEIKEAEKKFLKIKKIGDEVSEKLNRFLSDKRRIDEMEGDFKKLINMSQAVDARLENVTDSYDTMQKIQSDLRDLGELENEVTA
ncbi:MAG: SpiroCoCo family coiled-coil protein, partial [bacterium]